MTPVGCWCGFESSASTMAAALTLGRSHMQDHDRKRSKTVAAVIDFTPRKPTPVWDDVPIPRGLAREAQ